jgi:hypothetical protein
MKKIVILLLSVTSMFAVAETYHFKAPISSIIEESVFTSGVPSAPAVAALIETGPRGTISLRGSNGLTSLSYSSRTNHAGTFAADRAFNGSDMGNNIINSEYDVLDSRGYWFNKAKHVPSGSFPTDWIQVDFGQDVNIARFAIYNFYSHTRQPKNTIVQISNDGVNWVNHQETAFLNASGWQTVTLNSPVITRFFRLHILDNHGDSRITIDEIEIYQN